MANVDSNENVFRRGYLNQANKDGSANGRNFKPRSKDDGMLSVDIKSITSIQASVVDSSKYALFELNVGDIHGIWNEQNENLIVQSDPIPENPAHALIIKIEPDDDITPLKLASISDRIIL